MMANFNQTNHSFLKYISLILSDHHKHTLDYYFIRKINYMNSENYSTLVITQTKQVIL
jgi:hypothetical protein